MYVSLGYKVALFFIRISSSGWLGQDSHGRGWYVETWYKMTVLMITPLVVTLRIHFDMISCSAGDDGHFWLYENFYVYIFQVERWIPSMKYLEITFLEDIRCWNVFGQVARIYMCRKGLMKPWFGLGIILGGLWGQDSDGRCQFVAKWSEITKLWIPVVKMTQL